ncbi:MAG: MBOAT family O-acyltransferase [Ruminococcus sp.]|nr:MBOAT family O-acyltransferase [Ruminococcus sp.]
MVFSSSTFLLIFLPITLLAYFIIGGALTKSIRVKNIILLIASLVFYAWGEPVYIVLMLISIVFNFFIGKDMAASKDKNKAKILFVCAIVFNIAVLGFFKYSGFIAENLGHILNLDLRMPSLPLPVGISFYTFQIMSYIIDLYRDKIKAQNNIISFALYISLFPQLIAGPIVKYKDIERQLTHRRESVTKYSQGLSRFVVGLSKKLLLANTLGSVYSSVQASDIGSLSTLSAWIGIVCYTLQIYFDFSGYSDMAIGLGKMFGFSFCENFRYPYLADSVTDFWRRWHISLSSWFKEYVYIPLGGNRKKTPRVIANLMIVWLLTGLWHGAAWNFVLWGVYYGVLLILEKYVLDDFLKIMPDVLKRIITIILVMVGWVLFSSNTFADALNYLRIMFTLSGGVVDSYSLYLLTSNIILIAVGLFCCVPIYKRIAKRFDTVLVSRIKAFAFPVLLILCYVYMISETYNPFLYFRF